MCEEVENINEALAGTKREQASKATQYSEDRPERLQQNVRMLGRVKKES